MNPEFRIQNPEGENYRALTYLQVIKFEFARKAREMGIPLPKPEHFDKTCRMTPLVDFAPGCTCPPSAVEILPCLAEGKRGGINF